MLYCGKNVATKAAEENELSNEDKETVDSSLEVIQEEMKSEKPRKNYIKMALSGLKAIKGTAEFSAAIAALVQFIQPFIG